MNKLILLKELNNPITYLKDYFGYSKGIILYKCKNGLKFHIRSGTDDRVAFNEIILYDIYQKHFKIKKGDTVVDIGSHAGIFSVYAVQEGASRVYAYEPNEDNCVMATGNSFANDMADRISLFQEAVSNKSGLITFYKGKDNAGGSSYFKQEGEVQVSSTTLKNIFIDNKIKRINFLKVDCEGAEYDILYNLEKKYLNRIDKIVVECHLIDHTDNNIYAMNRFLSSKGFKTKIGAISHPNKSYENFGIVYAWRRK